MRDDLFNLSRKVAQYKEVLSQTGTYREAWKNGLKDKLIKFLEESIKDVGLKAKVETRNQLENMEAVVLTLGDVKSGMYQKVILFAMALPVSSLTGNLGRRSDLPRLPRDALTQLALNKIVITCVSQAGR